MSNNDIDIIDKKIEELIKDKYEYNFVTLKDKVEEILKSVNIFFIENEVNTKALDMYLKTVITQRNKIKKEHEKIQVNTRKETKYTLIEDICKRYEFESQDALIKKVDELSEKTISQLREINYNLAL